MTTEEKAKAYDELFVKASRIYNKENDVLIMHTIEVLFPELKGSDGERIRKALISFLKSPFVNENITDEKVTHWIALLEKLKVFAEHGDGLYYFGNNGFTYVGNPTCDNVLWIEKQGEQKPTDEEMKELLRTEYEKGKADAIAEMQKSWSEEDKIFKDKIMNSLIYNIQLKVEDILDINYWFDSLKNRVQPQQEKERILEKLEEWLDEYISNLADVGTDTLIGSFRKYLDGKLPDKPKSQWKPSEEQMNALNDVISSRDLSTTYCLNFGWI